ncbi:threonine/serine exporter family protein [Ereboglobus luteus]|uniref:Threonine/serine exporter-like N-terminal domain-containing protein n=1 Tax=Ereboglobus luteus TaxID=1796921 RepID=A0A2U8E2Q4_9BACT|nr:threonine/serine exporter family protein [Ereboglobus luteus]AWI09159.1 hypothetical protein CKA38_07825 [Ereboglobus luteus]
MSEKTPESNTSHRAPLTLQEHRAATDLCLQTGILLMQHGVESAFVESITRRTGFALELDRVDVAIMANAITVTSYAGPHSMTRVRRNEDRGINMHVAMEVQRAALAFEAGEIDRAKFEKCVRSVKTFRYPRWLVVLAIGLSCACFARLAGADWIGCGFAFVASAAAMVTRQVFAHFHFNPIVGFFAAAFVATSICAQALLMSIGTTPRLAMAASVLLLVPGFPLINGVSDMVKGYVNTGISRIALAMLMALATCAGIVLAMSAWDTWGWVS